MSKLMLLDLEAVIVWSTCLLDASEEGLSLGESKLQPFESVVGDRLLNLQVCTSPSIMKPRGGTYVHVVGEPRASEPLLFFWK